MRNNKQKPAFLDFKGYQTDWPLNPKRAVGIGIAVAVFVICCLLPLSHVSETAGASLGLVLGVACLWVTNCVPMTIATLILAAGSLILHLVTLQQFQTSFGSSAFLSMVGMITVSMGANKTNFARRVSYLCLYKLGKSPTLIVLAIGISTAIISAFVSNLATTIVMSSISIGILTELNEKKGESGLGKAVMLAIPMYSMVGGMALMSGSPAMNMVGVNTLENATQGLYTVSYKQWAIIGIICALLITLPTWIIYVKSFKVTNNNSQNIDTNGFRDKLHELGPVAGAELRWILTVVFMIGSMIAGIMDLTTASLLCACITICPVVGTVKAEEALKSLPMDMLLMVGLSPIIATIFDNSKIGTYLVSNTLGWAMELQPFVLMLILCLALTILNNIFANATAGIIAVCVASFTPLVISAGLNPSVMMIPVMFMGSATTVLGVQATIVLTYSYGYWEMNDTIKPGIITALVWAVIISAAVYVVCPMIGMPLYL